MGEIQNVSKIIRRLGLAHPSTARAAEQLVALARVWPRLARAQACPARVARFIPCTPHHETELGSAGLAGFALGTALVRSRSLAPAAFGLVALGFSLASPLGVLLGSFVPVAARWLLLRCRPPAEILRVLHP